jgi:Zn-dependent protease
VDEIDWVHAILFYAVLLISLVVHEAAHALAALWGGDRTAYLGGQVTLNPMPHIRREPFGTVLLPIAVLIFSGATMCMGYAYTPIDPIWAYRHPKKAALMSAAGPLSNFVLAGIALLVLKILVVQGHVEVRSAPFFEVFLPSDGATDGGLFATCNICAVFLLLNLLLGILNLIPWPPLDGAGILGGFFPKTMGRVYEYLRTQPLFMLMGFAAIFFTIQKPVILAFNYAVILIKVG